MHHGFYSAYHNTSIRPAVLDAIAEANEIYGDLKIMVTGHSMGGAMAAFCGLDLIVRYISFFFFFFFFSGVIFLLCYCCFVLQYGFTYLMFMYILVVLILSRDT